MLLFACISEGRKFNPKKEIMAVQTANVVVKNETGKTLRSVNVVHKYSDDYKNKEDWGRLSPNGSTAPALRVEYNTGALTTGRDWWVVSWEYEGDDKLYHTDPNNMRGFVDILEKASAVAIPIALAAAGAAVGAGATAGAGTAAGGAAAAAAGTILSNALFNAESTSGFKQHILRSEDADKTMSIIIDANNDVTFDSKSGKSKTGSSFIAAN